MCGRKFTIKTVCMAAKQMVSALFVAAVAIIYTFIRSLAFNLCTKNRSSIATSNPTIS